MNLKKYMQEIEMRVIKDAMIESKGSKADAARLLGVNRTALVEKLKRYGMLAKYPRPVAKIKKANKVVEREETHYTNNYELMDG